MADAKQGLLSKGRLEEIRTRDEGNVTHEIAGMVLHTASSDRRRLLRHIAALESALATAEALAISAHAGRVALETDPVRRFLAHPRAVQLLKHDGRWSAVFFSEGDDGWTAVASSATDELACAAALRALEEGGRDGDK